LQWTSLLHHTVNSSGTWFVRTDIEEIWKKLFYFTLQWSPLTDIHTWQFSTSYTKQSMKAHRGTAVTFLMPLMSWNLFLRWSQLQGICKSWLKWGQVNKVGSRSPCRKLQEAPHDHVRISTMTLRSFTQISVSHIFITNLMNCLWVNIQLIFQQCKGHAMVSGHQFTNVCNHFHILRRWQMSTPWVIFKVFMPLYESFIKHKKRGIWDTASFT